MVIRLKWGCSGGGFGEGLGCCGCTGIESCVIRQLRGVGGFGGRGTGIESYGLGCPAGGVGGGCPAQGTAGAGFFWQALSGTQTAVQALGLRLQATLFDGSRQKNLSGLGRV